ncbi:MAG: biopolymer transporter ExbD [Burkholderiaceae bacterium]|nr:biopolymer transporter ExbD [Burkholderiaceae bacterium]
MAFASFDSNRSAGPMTDINMVPLIDVLLVLLVIFIVTAPLLTHAVKLDLPQVSSQPHLPKPAAINFAIDAQGALFWDGAPISREQAAERFVAEAVKQPQPEVHLRADESVAYRYVAQTLADASRAGLTKLGFVSEPTGAAHGAAGDATVPHR